MTAPGRPARPARSLPKPGRRAYPTLSPPRRAPGAPRRKGRHDFPRARPGAETHVFRCKSQGARLDQYLATRFTGYSRSFLAGLCREGRVLVAGNRAKPGRRLLP